MSYVKSSFTHPELKKNAVGYRKRDYEGVISTLCAGCGHDSISAAIVQACYDINLQPHNLVKLSGIGCSSKTPAYFLSNSHGFNAVHGRMPSVATGANLANKKLTYLGVSGDGDSASIGLGQFVHVIRRNVDVTYILMNNGCYGLTKGQDSATADFGSISKTGAPTPFQGIDLVGMALELGASFVARSFSGDKEQLIPLIKAALSHSGFAFLDVISPCVTFNNNRGSTKSYDYVRAHNAVTSELDYIPIEEEITVSYEEGQSKFVELFDGSKVLLNKLAPEWDPTNRYEAIDHVEKTKLRGELVTGLLYIDPKAKDLHKILNTVETPLNQLTERDLYPGPHALDKINASFR